MSKIFYADSSFTEAALGVIADAERICDNYARQGYRLTLRQLYYRFIADDLFPESRRDRALGTKNTERNYKWLGDLVSKARVGGRIDWNHITDRTRRKEGGDSGWSSPEAAARSILDWYSISKWNGQAHYLEVWVEKEALVDVISAPASRWNVGHMACKGSPSTSVIHEAAQRLRRYEDAGRKTHVIYLGDHDPTGLDIDRDIQDRLRLFRSMASVERIALTMEQVEELDPPPSPAKVTDSRTNGYIEMYGTDECWELDAIEPAELDRLVEEAILGYLDMAGWNERVRQEADEKRVLTAVADNWQTVVDYLEEEGLVPEPEDDEESGDEDDDDES